MRKPDWSPDAPTAEEAQAWPLWWFRGWLDCFKPKPSNDRTAGVLLVLDPDPLGEGIEAAEVPLHVGEEGEHYTVENCRGEWSSCVLPPTSETRGEVSIEGKVTYAGADGYVIRAPNWYMRIETAEPPFHEEQRVRIDVRAVEGKEPGRG